MHIHNLLSFPIPLTCVPTFHSVSHTRFLICSQELDAVARDWTKPPPEAIFTLRVPVEFASLQASVQISVSSVFHALIAIQRLVTGPYVYLTGEDSFQIAIMGVQGLRVEIVSDAAPPPEDEPPYVSFSLRIHATRC
jgi:hypothetical protein